MSRFWLSAALAAGLGFAALAAPAEARPEPHSSAEHPRHGMRHGHGMDELPMDRMLKRLDLTAAQQAQIRAIRERYRQSSQPQRQELMAKRQELFRSLTRADATLDASLAKQRELDAMQAKLAEGRIRAWFESRQVLTAEQLKKLESLKVEAPPRRQNKPAEQR